MCEPGAIVGIEGRTRPRQDAHRDDRHGGPLGHEQDDAVRQDLPVREGRPEGGAGHEHAHEADDGSRGTSTPISSGGHRAFGNRTPTLLPSGANQAPATRVRSAAVTARIFVMKESLSS